MTWRNRRVLITGGTGFLGWHLIHALLRRGARVRSFALAPQPSHPILQLPIDIVAGDIRDPDAVARAAAGCDLIFHTAGSVAVWGPAIATMHAVHAEGTRNVVAAARPGVRIVHTSSIVAVGATHEGFTLNEDSPFNLIGVKLDYVHAKRAAERIARDADDVVIVNPGYLVGPDDHEPSVMGKFCARAWRGRMVLAARGGFNLVDVRDVAAGHLAAAERGRPGRRYILGGENVWMPEFHRRLAEVAGQRPRAIPSLTPAALWALAAAAELRALKTRREPYPSFQHVRLNRYAWFVDSSRARIELGYSARPLDETLRDTYDWFTAQGQTTLRGLPKWWARPAA